MNISDLRFFGNEIFLLSLSCCFRLISRIFSCITSWRATRFRWRNSLLLLSLGFGVLKTREGL